MSKTSYLLKNKETGSYWGYSILPSSGGNGVIGAVYWGKDRNLLSERRTWFESEEAAERKLNKVKENKISIEYKVIESSNEELQNTRYAEDNVEEVEKIELPNGWEEVRKVLSAVERNIYEKHDDKDTVKFARLLCARFKRLILESKEDKETIAVRRSIFLLIRLVYLRSLVDLRIYKPDLLEAASITSNNLVQESKDVPQDHKDYIFSEIGSFTKDKKFSVKIATKSIDVFVSKVIREIENETKIGVGGVLRSRTQKVKARMKDED